MRCVSTRVVDSFRPSVRPTERSSGSRPVFSVSRRQAAGRAGREKLTLVKSTRSTRALSSILTRIRLPCYFPRSSISKLADKEDIPYDVRREMQTEDRRRSLKINGGTLSSNLEIK